VACTHAQSMVLLLFSYRQDSVLKVIVAGSNFIFSNNCRVIPIYF